MNPQADDTDSFATANLEGDVPQGPMLMVKPLSAPGKGKSSRLKALGCCNWRRNSGRSPPPRRGISRAQLPAEVRWKADNYNNLMDSRHSSTPWHLPCIARCGRGFEYRTIALCSLAGCPQPRSGDDQYCYARFAIFMAAICPPRPMRPHSRMKHHCPNKSGCTSSR